MDFRQVRHQAAILLAYFVFPYVVVTILLSSNWHLRRVLHGGKKHLLVGFALEKASVDQF